MKSKKYMKIHTSVYRGNLMTFQHYLNCYHNKLSFDDREKGEEQFYKIRQWYRDGILKKIEIKLDEEWAKRRAEYVRK